MSCPIKINLKGKLYFSLNSFKTLYSLDDFFEYEILLDIGDNKIIFR